jgi:hypothetical protein
MKLEQIIHYPLNILYNDKYTVSKDRIPTIPCSTNVNDKNSFLSFGS